MQKFTQLFLVFLILLSLVTVALYKPNADIQYLLNKPQTQLIIEKSAPPLAKTRKIFDLDLHYQLNNAFLCQNNSEDILAIIIVTSYFGHSRVRNSMRRAVSDKQLRLLKLRRLFLLAENPEDKFVKQNTVVKEAEIFNDIVQGNFLEAYKNLTYKHLMGVKWVCEFCAHAKYIIKMDDDIVIDMIHLTSLLKSFDNISQKKFMSGYVLKNMKPIRDLDNKWYVSSQEYKPNFYPTFLSGWFYITNPRTFQKIAEFADKVKYFWIDDILVTGILAQMARVKRIDISKCFTYNSEFLKCCIKDLEKQISCKVMIGPNGGDDDLFYKFNEKLKVCEVHQCQERQKSLNETCIAEYKVNLGRGKAFVSNFKLK